MAHAYTTHRITAHGNDRMVLTDCETGLAVVEATRDGDQWRLNVNGQEKQTIPTADRRHDTITAMNKLAFQTCGQPWISIKEPHRVIDDKGTLRHIRDEQ
ncbi:hypothetical protein [Mycobacterium intracellulare]|uniref:hypothetical protein n=1 Tax=Mycobacterium intracellulare TaxID=1767 RepID=UPI00109E4B9A|nr:hypothetical protein [Mycobacterium intracellulare]